MNCLSIILTVGLIAGKASPEMTNPSFWANSDAIIMDADAIAQYNASLKAEGDLDLVDIFSLPGLVSGEEVRKAIEAYSIPANYRYIGKFKSSAEQRSRILASRSLESIAETVYLRYGVLTEPADLRSFPTTLTCTDEGVISGPLCFDDFQQTQLRLGEAVLIWHSSNDGNWFFVRAENYAGWIEASKVGLCSREEMIAYVQSSSFAITLEQKQITIDSKAMRLMMGTRFALDASGSVIAPIRKKDGSLGLKQCSLDVELSIGYLPYTLNNLMKQAFKLLGTPYSWGGAGGYNDCSATLLSVYQCFGIELPRNSSSMVKMDKHNYRRRQMDFSIIQPGSLAIVPGHAMMFLGLVDGEVYILHDVNALYYPSPKGGLRKQQCSSTIISSTSDVYRKTGLSFFDSFTNIIEVR